jgi:hypothetical protein
MDREKMVGNLELVKEFFANAYQGDATRKVYVRGVLVDYSGDAINRFLRTRGVNQCAYMPLYHCNTQTRYLNISTFIKIFSKYATENYDLIIKCLVKGITINNILNYLIN